MNAFSYDYAPPAATAGAPVAAHLEVASAPWAPDHKLVRIGLKAREMASERTDGDAVVVAQDVNVWVVFNPQRVAMYRLLGYEGRARATEVGSAAGDEGGEMHAGRAITALYEIVPVAPGPSDLAAMAEATTAVTDAVDPGSLQLLAVHVRARMPAEAVSEDWSFSLNDRDAAFAAASEDFRFAGAVAGFGLVLRDSTYARMLTLVDVRGWAERALGFEPSGRRQEFVGLIDRAQALWER